MENNKFYKNNNKNQYYLQVIFKRLLNYSKSNLKTKFLSISSAFGRKICKKKLYNNTPFLNKDVQQQYIYKNQKI